MSVMSPKRGRAAKGDYVVQTCDYVAQDWQHWYTHKETGEYEVQALQNNHNH